MRTVGKVRDGDEVIVIFDDGTDPLWVDIVTEISEHDGIVRMSFAAISTNGDGVPKADVAVRLRMRTDLAWSICRSLKALEGGH
jgi:hypothetical protein